MLSSCPNYDRSMQLVRETVDGSGPGGVFIHESRANCGPIVSTGDLPPSPPGAVLQQAREPKPATGETAATPGTRSPKIGMHPRRRACQGDLGQTLSESESAGLGDGKKFWKRKNQIVVEKGR